MPQQFTVSDADWKDGTVLVSGAAISRPGRYTIGLLARAARETDAELRPIYAAVLHQARLAVAADREQRVAAHHGLHQAADTVETVYQGGGSDEHQAAHGNITVTEYCTCGAERRSHLNGRHVDAGEWA